MVMKFCVRIVVLAAAGLLVTATAFSQGSAPDNGTDPTKLSRSASVSMERTALRGGFESDSLELLFGEPFGAKKDYKLNFKVPVARVNVLGNSEYGIGDLSLKVVHLYQLTRAYGILLGGEMVFDTAQRAELGGGKNVFKGSLIYAKFLEGGAIFAPAVVQSNSLWGDDSRARVSNTVLDFYYVPKLADPKTFVTFDPALSFDWEASKQFASLAVSVGRSLGPAFGGNSVISIKPTVFAGGDRPGKWGVEIAYKVIGF
jgi:hypothetical protein